MHTYLRHFRDGGLLRLRSWHGLVIGICGLFFFVTAVSLLWPLPAEFVHPEQAEPSRIVDRNGALLYAVRDPRTGDSDAIALAQMPLTFVTAVLDTEDRRFRSHPGIDPVGLVRALWQNASAGRIVSGASTISQQLVRIRAGVRPRSVLTKLREMRDAIRLEMALTKDEILEAYLNSAYFGHQAYGAQSAATTYFGKNLSELSLSEQTLLAGLLQSPSAYDPFKSWDAAKKRQKTVLAAMVDAADLTKEIAEETASEHLTLSDDRVPIAAPHFVFWVQNRAPERLTPGATVTTTLDLPLQQETERIITQKLEKLRDQNVMSAAVVVLDAKNGDVLAMVGSADYFDTLHDGSVNVATAPRQPGSALKPFTYALALLGGDTLATTVADVEARYFTEEGNPYTPRNYDYEEHGLVRYREALANSYNIAAVKVVERVGVERLMRFLQASGITTLNKLPEHYGLALTLGDAEVRLLELAQAYGIFARGGNTLPLRVFSDDGASPGTNVLDERIAWLIGSALSDDAARLSEFGADGPLNFPFPVAVKTGTTRNGRDNWTIGFTGDRIVGVWVGNPDNTPMRNISGVTGAAPIMHDVMLAAMAQLPKNGIPQPSGIVEREICRLSGKLPTDTCSERLNEFFVVGTEPTKEDDLWKTIRIDRRNGLLANDSCPPSEVEQKTIAIFSPDLRSWAAEHGWPTPPARLSPLCSGSDSSAPQSGELRIIWPHNGDSFELDPLIPDDRETIVLRAETSTAIDAVKWFVNGKHIGTGTAPEHAMRWQPSPGTWTIEARAGEEKTSITLFILKKGSP